MGTDDKGISRRKFVASSFKAMVGAGLVLSSPQLLSGSTTSKKNEQKRILALVGSPRKGGNTDTLTRELLKSANENGAITEKIYLADKNIAPCGQCEYCHHETWNKCRIEDDFNMIVEKMMKADIIILATPIWWSSMHSLLKLFLDRCYSLVSKDWKQFRLEGKEFVLISVQGEKDLNLYANPLVKAFKGYAKWMKFNVIGTLVASAKGKGEIVNNKEIISEAVKMGKSLAA